MESFALWPSLIGGLMIGVASAMLWMGNGRIAGISGVFGRLLPPGGDVAWRLTFLGSLIAGGMLAAALTPGIGFSPPPPELVGGPVWLAVGGLLVGLGTKIGNGCTSGHGVCGLARFSTRSLTNVVIFFGVAIITVALTGIVS
jgi:uncharacterized protein